MDSVQVSIADRVAAAVGLLRVAAHAMRSVTTPLADEIRAVHAAVNALQAHEADLLAAMDATKAHESEGCASVATWAARELVQDVSTTRQMVRAAKTMTDLPSIGQSAHAGRVSLNHVNALTYALKHVGHEEIVNVEAELKVLAEGLRPAELFEKMRLLKAIAQPDELDEAWLRGMDKEDIQCLRVLDGFHLNGHLGPDVGAKLHAFLRSAAVPRDAEDDRTSAQRRIDGLDELLTQALGNGLPAEGGVQPQVSVVVDADTLRDALNGNSAHSGQRPLDLDAEPAVLEGFGPIGPALLAYLAWGADLTPILVAGIKANRQVLDAGRTQRLATRKQRQIIRWRQKGRCANPGCHHPIGEIHHVVDWLSGGRTDLDNLAGLCRKCHALVTIGKLTMTGSWDTGYLWSTSRAGPGGTSRLRGMARTG
ncbi:MAG: DUF222 domain-containing protein [Aeromicrobium sp.]